MSAPPSRHVLWSSPAWQHTNPAAADRAELLRRSRRGDRLPAFLRSVLAVSPTDAEARVLRRPKVAQSVLAVLGEWGHATACQIGELTGLPPLVVRGSLFDMLAAGWIARGQIGFHFDTWVDAEFWRLAASFDADWLLDMFGLRAMVESFGGRPLARLSGQHHARHDVFTVDAMLEVAARSPGVATVLGPASAHPEILFGGDGAQAADMAVVRDDGHVLFVEAGLSETGGARRMEQYARLFDRVGGSASVVFFDMLQPVNDRRGPRRSAEVLLAEMLAGRPFDGARLRDRFMFASWADWFVDGGFAAALPARVPVSDACDEFRVVEALTVGVGAPLPGWLAAHRMLPSVSFLLRRQGDRLVWHDWLDGDWVLAGLPA